MTERRVQLDNANSGNSATAWRVFLETLIGM